MTHRLPSITTKVLAVVVLALMLIPGTWAVTKFKILHGVPGGLFSGLTLDAKGNLYGATGGGGNYNAGTIFELMRQPNGKWTEGVLHSFNPDTDGSDPNGGLIFDAAGNLYGTALFGGLPCDDGTVVELTPGSSDWTLNVIHSFQGTWCGSDGYNPAAGLVLDKVGNLYGTTVSGGLGGQGTVFELTSGSGGWSESILYGFGSKPYDGSGPLDTPIFDKAGNLYGTTHSGGDHHLGTVFKLRQTSGGWKESLLWQFGLPNDGAGPYAGVVFDGKGDLYGTTVGGGINACNGGGCGTVFKLTPGSHGWRESLLHKFTQGKDGSGPTGGVVFDKAGNLYGATVTGGIGKCSGGCGVVYKLMPSADGKWKYSVLHRFTGADGGQPLGGLILDAKGNLYGTAYSVVFEITP
jgi:uncharacterized repeat protein (TIGR03803 family)